jgi:hypothetical protein
MSDLANVQVFPTPVDGAADRLFRVAANPELWPTDLMSCHSYRSSLAVADYTERARVLNLVRNGGNFANRLCGDEETDEAILLAYLEGRHRDNLKSFDGEALETEGDSEEGFIFGPNPHGPAPMIEEFNALEDQLELSYDPNDGQAPEIRISPDPRNDGDGVVFANGLAVAVIRGGAELTPDMVRLVPTAARAKAA